MFMLASATLIEAPQWSGGGGDSALNKIAVSEGGLAVLKN
jgi:hypothetical protein